MIGQDSRFSRLFEEPPEEGEWVASEVTGAIPAGLRGTWFRAGPGDFGCGAERLRHWLDGDGLVVALRFEGAPTAPRLVQTQRFVETQRRLEERRAGRRLYRAFGTATPGDRLVYGVVTASPANVSVVPFAGRVLVAGEQGRPYELDPGSLRTLGEWTGGGRLTAVSPFAAHAKIDPPTGDLVGFGVSFAQGRPSLTLYRFARDGTPRERHRIPLEAPVSLHDFAITRRWAVFWCAPYLLDVEALRSGASVLAALRWRPERGSRLLVVDRRDGTVVGSVPVGAGYCLHLGNAHELSGGELVVDVLELDRPVYDRYTIPDLFATGAGLGRPVRLRVDPAAGRVLERIEIAGVPAPDFPAFDADRAGAPTGRWWCLGIADPDAPGPRLFDEVVALDAARGVVSGRHGASPGAVFAGEPVFVPDDADDPGIGRPGWLLVPETDVDAGQSRLLVLAADDLDAGPVATIRFPRPIHLGFHAVWHAGSAGRGVPSALPSVGSDRRIRRHRRGETQ